MAVDTAVDVRDWLRAQLAGGPARAGEVQALAESIGITAKQLRTAREAICRPPTRESGRGAWLWQLREVPDDPTTEEAHVPDAAPESQQVAAPALQWITTMRQIGALSGPETGACRWLVGRLAGRPRRRMEVEALAVDEFVDLDALRAALEHLVAREGTETLDRTAEIWALRDHLPQPPADLVAEHVRKAAVARGWNPDPRTASWIPAAGPDWLVDIHERHARRVVAADEANAERDAHAAHVASVIAEHQHELAEAGPIARALVTQVTEPARTAAEHRRLVDEVKRTRQARVDLRERHRREDAEAVVIAGRQARGQQLPPGWEPGQPIVLHEPNRARQHQEVEAAKTAAEGAEGALAAHREAARRPRVVGLSLTDLS